MTQPSPEAQEFLKEIIANPEDDAVRLIYADWLEDHGDPRGELIRVQCELESMSEFDVRRGDYERREKELLKTLEERGLTGANFEWGHSFGFRRGFLDRMSLTLYTGTLEDVSEKLRWEPLRELQIEWLPEEYLAELVDWSFLSRVRSLDLSYMSWEQEDDCPLVDILSSPHLSQLSELTLQGCIRGLEGARILAGGRSLGNLKKLTLSDCPVGAAGWRTVLASPFLANMEELALVGERILSTEAQILADSLRWEKLHSLRLPWTGITDNACQFLARASWMDRLTTLDLCNNDITSTGLTSLARSQHLRRLRSLSLAENFIDQEGAKVFGQSEIGQTVQTLDLSGNRLTTVGVQLLLEPGNLSNLCSLDLSSNQCCSRGLQVIAQSEHLSSLRKLNLSGNRFSEGVGIRDLIEKDRLPELQQLDLSHCNLPSTSIAELCSSQFARQLTHLHLYANDLRSMDQFAVLSLADSPRLQKITLGGSGIKSGDSLRMHAKLREAFGSRWEGDFPF